MQPTHIGGSRGASILSALVFVAVLLFVATVVQSAGSSYHYIPNSQLAQADIGAAGDSVCGLTANQGRDFSEQVGQTDSQGKPGGEGMQVSTPAPGGGTVTGTCAGKDDFSAQRYCDDGTCQSIGSSGASGVGGDNGPLGAQGATGAQTAYNNTPNTASDIFSPGSALYSGSLGGQDLSGYFNGGLGGLDQSGLSGTGADSNSYLAGLAGQSGFGADGNAGSTGPAGTPGATGNQTPFNDYGLGQSQFSQFNNAQGLPGQDNSYSAQPYSYDANGNLVSTPADGNYYSNLNPNGDYSSQTNQPGVSQSADQTGATPGTGQTGTDQTGAGQNGQQTGADQTGQQQAGATSATGQQSGQQQGSGSGSGQQQGGSSGGSGQQSGGSGSGSGGGGMPQLPQIPQPQQQQPSYPSTTQTCGTPGIAYDASGNPCTSSCTINVTPATITPGQSAELTWTTQGGLSASISGLGSVNADGSQSVEPGATTNYAMTVNGYYGTSGCSTTLTVGGTGVAPTASLTCSPQVADVGQTLTFNYACSSGTATGNGFTTSAQPSGTATGAVATPPSGTNTATYSLACNDSSTGLSSSAQCSVQVGAASIILTADPKTLQSGQTSTIGWITSGMQSCAISSPDDATFTSNNSSDTSANGTAQSDPITGPTTFLLQCQTLGGQEQSAQTTVGLAN